MVDPVALVQSVISLMVGAFNALEGAEIAQTNMQNKLDDYKSVLQSLERDPRCVSSYEISHELNRLKKRFEEVKNLTRRYTPQAGDSRCVRMCKAINRGLQHKDINKELATVNGDVEGLFHAINVKTAILITGALHQSQRQEARVPFEAARLPDTYVKRNALLDEVVDKLTGNAWSGGGGGVSPTPWVLLGMGGSGKTVLASSVIRHMTIRRHYRRGIFWLKVGQYRERELLAVLLPLVRAISSAPMTDNNSIAPIVVVHHDEFDTVEDAVEHLRKVIHGKNSGVSDSPFRHILVVLDNVWNREVVDVLARVGVQLLVTTRDGSVVPRQSGRTEVGDMTNEEALRLLALAAGQTGSSYAPEVEEEMQKVVDSCARLPLALAITGSMEIVRRDCLSSRGWGALNRQLQDKTEMQRMKGDEVSSVSAALYTSFDALASGTQKNFLKMAVLPKRTVASVPMLLNLWAAEDKAGTRDKAQVLVDRCLVQMTEDGYIVHDLLLDFVKRAIGPGALSDASELQAQYLTRVEVLSKFAKAGDSATGLYALLALWRAVDDGWRRQDEGYTRMLGELDTDPLHSGDNARLRWATGAVARLFQLQGEVDAAMKMQEKSLVLRKDALGVDHPDVAKTLSKMAELARIQGDQEKVKKLLERSHEIRTAHFPSNHRRVVQSKNNRAVALCDKGQYAEAEPLFREVLAADEQEYGPDHERTTQAINNLAGILSEKGDYEEATKLYDRCLNIRSSHLGPEHLDVASALNSKARMLRDQRKYDEAVLVYEESREIREKALGSKHSDVAHSLKNIAEVRRRQGEIEKALELVKQELEIHEQRTDSRRRSALAEARKRHAVLLIQASPNTVIA